ncbi:head-tail adaptor protein [Frigidibacter sp. ROC022]|uniref:head-tail adaptor protein n=1 Tax=Frigidibacter sp. ROC022 TaxID=2971796 RepID=UPI00215AF633|nr:head-tail adaptor protein [Frigidibacter sp. ROC022]MCR8723627.1 head-tail adaptor protein [Frigidibacter sp. ROC022]
MSFRLTRAMVLEAASRLPDGAGGYTETWVPLGTHWVEVRSGTGKGGAADLVALAQVPLRIIVRAAPEGALSRPKPGQRFREGQRRFRILAVTEADRDGLYLTCFAREEAAA